MKVLELNQILDKLKLEKMKETIMIKQVVTDVENIDHNTLVFNINKTSEINSNKFSQLNHCYIITDQPFLKKDKVNQARIIYVVDVEKVYHEFIQYYRGLFHFPVIAVTGTCGKTTTKEIIKQLLGKNYKVVGTIRSKNALRFNHNYLMEIDDSVNYAVYETALTHPGHIVYNCNYFRPDIGVITNIGIDHLNQCKTVENYIRIKGEMLAGLRYKGILIINGDDENIRQIDFTPYKGTIITFGLDSKNDLYATDISYHKKGMTFNLHHHQNKYPAYIPGFGEHNVYNALAALAVLYTLGFKFEDTIALLKDYKHVQSHMEFHKGKNDSIIVDDTWSSNPTSVKAALEVFKGNYQRKIAILGKIEYLGKHELAQAKEIGKMVAKANIDYLITKDEFSKQIGLEAMKHGMSEKKILYCPTKKELISKLEPLLEPGTLVLFKTSMLDKSINSSLKYFIIE